MTRTNKLKEIGYDDNIRMIDHSEFFFRAAGNIVSVLDKNAFVLHYRNRFDALSFTIKHEFKRKTKKNWERDVSYGKMTVYHGSYTSVKEPKLVKSKNTKDFGNGFYCCM